MTLSKHQERVLELFQHYRTLRVWQLKGIYSSPDRLKLCLQKLEALGLIRMLDYAKFEYIGGKE